MNADELFEHALHALPEAMSDLLREDPSPAEYVFANFDGASDLGIALIASDLVSELGIDVFRARDEAQKMIASANHRGEELVVSLMVTKEVLARILAASHVDSSTRHAVRVWLDGPLGVGRFRVVAIAGEQVRAAAVEGILDDVAPMAPPPSVPPSMLN